MNKDLRRPDMARRGAISAGLGLAATFAIVEGAQADMAPPPGSKTLADLAARLDKAPRRRDFKTVPMILNDRNLWDHEALDAVIAYRGGPKQVWDNTALDGPWLNLMRNALNVQVFAFRHPEFLVVSATHGMAHLALLDQQMWDKYRLAQFAGEAFSANRLIQPAGGKPNPADVENPEGFYSGRELSIPNLQRRGAVFLGCHNSLWELSARLIKAELNPDKLSHEAMTAELTNHLIAGAVLTPGIVGTLPELNAAGFFFAK
jgi:hypothetical protein